MNIDATLMRGRIIKYACLTIFLFCAAIFFFKPLEISDNWRHLSIGRWIFQNYQIPQYDIFAFTDIPKPSMSNEWLGSSLIYSVYLIGAEQGLKIFRTIVCILVLGIFFFQYFRKIPFSILLLLFTISSGFCRKFFNSSSKLIK